jgi:hypothetical protein
MGNNISINTSNKKTLAQTIDYIATNYILTQNFKDMKNLSDIDYCNKLVILTSDIIKNNLNNEEVIFLSQRLKGDIEINEMKKDNIIYYKKDIDIDIQNSTQKRRICIGISKFYIKIAHIFTAIIKTINSKDYETLKRTRDLRSTWFSYYRDKLWEKK